MDRGKFIMALQRISHKTAVLAKERGYDQQPYRAAHNNCEAYYPTYEDGSGEIKLNHPLFNPEKIIAVAPYQEELRKWLREKHGLHIEIPNNASGYMWILNKAGNVKEGDISGGTFIRDYNMEGDNEAGQWDSYEEALEVALYEALKYIK